MGRRSPTSAHQLRSRWERVARLLRFISLERNVIEKVRHINMPLPSIIKSSSLSPQEMGFANALSPDSLLPQDFPPSSSHDNDNDSDGEIQRLKCIQRNPSVLDDVRKKNDTCVSSLETLLGVSHPPAMLLAPQKDWLSRDRVSLIASDLILSALLFQTSSVIQGTLLSTGICVLYFLGIFVPVHASILQTWHTLDGLFLSNNLLYLLLTTIRFSLIYGMAYTAPGVYNSVRSTTFPFFVCLVALRCSGLVFELFCKLWLRIFSRKDLLGALFDGLPVILYLTCAILALQNPAPYEIMYGVWAAGVVFDFLIVSSKDALNNMCVPTAKFLTDVYSSRESAVCISLEPQIFAMRFQRMTIMTLSLFAFSLCQLYQSRQGVGEPDVRLSIIYSAESLTVGLLGFFIVSGLSRIYLVSSSSSSKKSLQESVYPLGYVTYWLHIPLHAALILTLSALKMTLDHEWNRVSGLASTDAHYDINLGVDSFSLNIWSTLPVPTFDAKANFLNGWVAKTSPEPSGLPPGVFARNPALGNSSRLDYVATAPSVLFASCLGVSLLIMLLLQLIEVFLKKRSHISRSHDSFEGPPHTPSDTTNWQRVIMEVFIRLICIIVCFILAALDLASSQSELIILTALVLLQVFVSEGISALNHHRPSN